MANDSFNLFVSIFVSFSINGLKELLPNSEKKELVYTLLDNQADACFVTEEILQKLQPVAKMLRHLTRKTLFLPKHRIKSHISKIKKLPSLSPIFNVVLRKFQHDLLL